MCSTSNPGVRWINVPLGRSSWPNSLWAQIMLGEHMRTTSEVMRNHSWPCIILLHNWWNLFLKSYIQSFIFQGIYMKEANLGICIQHIYVICYHPSTMVGKSIIIISHGKCPSRVSWGSTLLCLHPTAQTIHVPFWGFHICWGGKECTW